MFCKIIITSFFKGWGNSLNLVLPYLIKHPYGEISNLLYKDWKTLSGDIYRVTKQKKK